MKKKVVSEHLIDYLQYNKILTEFHHGFRANTSTETANLRVVDDVYRSLKEKIDTSGIFTDPSKASDSLNHGTVLHKP